MIRISNVKYINTLPYKIAFENSDFINKNVILTDAHPAGCVNELIEGKADIGLVPVAALSQLNDFNIIEGYGITSYRKVDSVLLLSQLPKDKLSSIYLDYQSRSSNTYLKIIAKKLWQKDLYYLSSEPGYEEQIIGEVGGVVIGDRALRIRKEFKYSYDIAEEWYKYCGLPIVFAVWVSNGKASSDFLKCFINVLEKGIENKSKIAKDYATKYNYFDLENYINERICYRINNEAKESLRIYNNQLQELNLL